MADDAAGKGQQTTQQPTIDRSVGDTVTLAEAALILTAEARVANGGVVDGSGS